jgi:hypothetical protein
VNNVKITIVGLSVTDKTDMQGVFKTGTAIPGVYDVMFTKAGYDTLIVNNVTLTAGGVVTMNIKMYNPTLVDVSGTTTSNGVAVPNVPVNLSNSSYSFNLVSDASGVFNTCNVVPGTYNIIAGAWGYKSYCQGGVVINSSGTVLPIVLEAMIYDDFASDNGWSVSGSASTGAWVRGEPAITSNMGVNANPGVDVTGDCSDKAYVTGNGGGQAGDDDVDGGSTVLTSPSFDLSAYNDPYVNYSRWFYNGGGAGSTPNDSLNIMLTNGLTTVTLETVLFNTSANSSWRNKSFKVKSFITPTANMKMIVRTADAPDGHIVEAGFDKFFVKDSIASTASVNELNQNGLNMIAYPNPFGGTIKVSYNLGVETQGTLIVRDVIGKVIEVNSLTNNQGVVELGASLSQGVYVIEIKSGEQNKVIRVIKSH